MTNYPRRLAGALLLCAAGPGLAATYTQAPGGSLTFTFQQAGAESRGSFKQFATRLDFDETKPATGRLEVKVQVASLDTQDEDRDTTLASPELFDATKFPVATFAATSFAKRADGRFDAVGKLTLRGVTKDLRLPLALVPATNGYKLSGETTIRRLDYGIGQGEWQSTEWVGDEVKLRYEVALVKAAAPAAPGASTK